MELINQANAKRNSAAISAVVIVPFQILTTTLLSLLLPLSFLLLARLATAHYLLSVSVIYPTDPNQNSILSYIFLNTSYPTTIVQLLVTLISVESLAYGLTGRILFLIQYPVTRCRLCTAWILLIAVQFFVGLGLEGSLAVGIDGSGFGAESSLVCRMVFFFGLHETMMFWGRAVVKPVVDDTVFGTSREEGLAEKVVMAIGYGGLWWWRLREELEALVVVPEVKRELMMGLCVTDFVGWWLYYLTVMIGMLRMVRGLILTVAIFTRRAEVALPRVNDDKV